MAESGGRLRWLQLVIGIVAMSMIANLQYGWTMFVGPIAATFHWKLSDIQWSFTLFVVAETWLAPIEGYLVDRFGPRPMILLGGFLVGLSWTINAFADQLHWFYISAVIGGIGAGAIYGTCVGNALKWFPDRRGLAAGLTAMGFGAGSGLSVVPIASMIREQGFQHTFLVFGILQGAVVLVLGLFLRAPANGRHEPEVQPQKPGDYAPWQMLRKPGFWVMYVMFVMMAAGGLMATAQLGPIAKDFGIAENPVTLLGLTLPALTFALSIDRFLNGITRPFFGWVSDQLGRENTMFIAFSLEGLGIIALSLFGHDPMAFVILTGLVFFAWGEIYSLFPATCGDIFGSRYATVNASMLYTAKGTASLLVPFSAMLVERGGWSTVFIIAAIFNILSALLAIFLLKPIRIRMQASQSSRGVP